MSIELRAKYYAYQTALVTHSNAMCISYGFERISSLDSTKCDVCV